MKNPLLATSNRILPALVTPLTPTGELDTKSAERLIDHLYTRGVGGLYVTGSTGEGVYLDFEIRRRLVELAVGMSAGRGQVMVHVGAIQTSAALELASHAAKVEADAVSSIPPFVGGFSWNEVHSYYRRLAEVSPLPVVAYYIPGLTGQAFSVDQLASLLSVPNIVGFKSTDANLYLMQRLLARFNDHQIMYNGPDELLALGLSMGAHGGIGTTYNFMPDLILQVARHVAAGQLNEATLVQKRVNEIIEVLLRFQGLAASKQILYWQGLIDHADCAAPRALLTTAAQNELRLGLEKTSLASSWVR